MGRAKVYILGGGVSVIVGRAKVVGGGVSVTVGMAKVCKLGGWDQCNSG